MVAQARTARAAAVRARVEAHEPDPKPEPPPEPVTVETPPTRADRVEGPIRCVECNEPIAVVASLDVFGRLWVTARFQGYLWVGIDARGRAMFRCGACAPREFLLIP